MNRITRMLSVTGLGILAGLTVGAGPALATTGTNAGAAKTASAAQGSDRDRVIRYFDSRRECIIAGRIGERFGRWDDFDCDRVGRHTWALEVSWDRDWFGHGNRHHGDRFPFRFRDRDHRDGPRHDRPRHDRPRHDNDGPRDPRNDNDGPRDPRNDNDGPRDPRNDNDGPRDPRNNDGPREPRS